MSEDGWVPEDPEKSKMGFGSGKAVAIPRAKRSSCELYSTPAKLTSTAAPASREMCDTLLASVYLEFGD
jgi:hypothetical protein